MIDTTGHVPPHDLDAEAALISCVLIDPKTLLEALRLCTPQDMYSEAHTAILVAANAVSESGGQVDIVTVASRLKETGKLSAAGGMSYLTTVLNCAPCVAHVARYARTVRELAQVRRVIAISTRTAASGYLPKESASAWLEKYRSDLGSIRLGADTGTLRPLKDGIVDSFKAHAEHMKSGRKLRGKTTGFIELDRILSGWHPGDLTVIGARPGMGKTSFALATCAAVARSEGEHVAAFSLEMPESQYADRIVCTRAGVPIHALRGELTASVLARLAPAVREASTWKIWIDDKSTSLADITAALWAKQREVTRANEKLGLVVIDFLQLMKYPNPNDENSSLNDITKDLKKLAKEMRVPILLLSQLNRSLEARPNKRPTIADLRGSGGIEQNADNIVFIYRDEAYNADSEDMGTAEIIVAKQRNGPTNMVRLTFDGPTTTFHNLLRAV